MLIPTSVRVKFNQYWPISMGDSSHLYFANEEVDGNETEYKQYCNGEGYYLSDGSETKDHWNNTNNTNWNFNTVIVKLK